MTGARVKIRVEHTQEEHRIAVVHRGKDIQSYVFSANDWIGPKSVIDLVQLLGDRFGFTVKVLETHEESLELSDPEFEE